jgi:hypothetical protein
LYNIDHLNKIVLKNSIGFIFKIPYLTFKCTAVQLNGITLSFTFIKDQVLHPGPLWTLNSNSPGDIIPVPNQTLLFAHVSIGIEIWYNKAYHQFSNRFIEKSIYRNIPGIIAREISGDLVDLNDGHK